MTRKPSDDESFSGLAFKIMADPFVGSLTFMRVYSGKIEKGTYAYNSVKGKKERIGRLLQMHANSREDVDDAVTGDIVAIAGLKDTTTGDTLCDQDKQIILERMEFPDPVIKVAVEPKTKADLRRCPRVSSSSPRRIPPSTSPATRRPTRRSSRVWASSTSRSSSTASSASSRLRLTSAPPR
jgi:hypothetical protein